MAERRIAVVGGGVAGLTAAWRARADGARVVLYEKSGVAGGLLSTADLGGVRIDTAVQLLSSTYTRFFALASEAGGGDLLVRASGRDALWRKGSAQEITYGNVASMVTSAALPTMLKLKLAAKYVPFLTLQLGGLDANDPASTGGLRYDGESITQWGKREVGDDFVDFLAYPLLAAYYGSPPEDTTAAMYHALARVGMDVELFAVRGGMSALGAAIGGALEAAGVEVRTHSTVTSLAANASGGWTVTANGISTTTDAYDGVIVATPPDTARSLIGAEAGSLHTWLAGARARTAATVGIVLEGAMRAPYFGLSFPRRDPPGDRIAALTVQQNKPSALVPPGRSALTVFPSPAVVERVASMSATEALTYLGPSLERVYPGILARVRASAVYAGDMRYRSLTPGFVRRIQELRGMKLPDGLAIAGDYTMAPTVEGAARSGERAAAQLRS